MLNPRVTSAGSIMPRYPWLIARDLDRSQMVAKVELMKNTFDVPYTQAQVDSADVWADNQAASIVKDIFSEAADIKKAYADKKAADGENFVPLEKKEIIALIAYLQRLGTDIKTTEIQTASTN
jgi:cytochrome c oxidase cbb3-type subunit I/II